MEVLCKKREGGCNGFIGNGVPTLCRAAEEWGEGGKDEEGREKEEEGIEKERRIDGWLIGQVGE